MSSSSEGRTAFAPSMPAEAQSAIRWVCTNNPFYVLSAGLFLAGLWLSFGDPEQTEGTWALMAGLAGYTLLLAGTAVLLIRFARVWDDARTVLLLVVLMFLATSVTFDRVLVFDVRFGPNKWPIRGITCNILGLVLAIAASEVVLRAVRLKLPTCYRAPFYLLLALFFVYPLALTPFLTQPRGKPMMWGLFGFSSAAALIFLTLLPAVRRGAAAVKKESPWPWPLYPWTLFGMLALAVPARALLLCYSMHQIDVRDLYEVTFGPYFLVPFGLVLTVLLLEAGLTTRRDGLIWAALTMPIGLVGLALVGHRREPIYELFLRMFTDQLGGDPVHWTLILSAGFYGYAALRRVSWAVEALTATLAVLTCIDPGVLQAGEVFAPQPAPLIVVATLLLGLGIWRRASWRCLLGALGLIAGVTLSVAGEIQIAPYRWWMAFHLVLLAMLIVGAAFDDELARALRFVGPGLALLACLAVIVLPIGLPASLPNWAIDLYPAVMAGLLAGYGYWLWHPPTLAMAGLIFAGWSFASGWQVYRVGRQFVVGLDYLVLSLVLFSLAILISLGKAGVLSRWLAAWRERTPDLVE
jgi:hypothetical protein